MSKPDCKCKHPRDVHRLKQTPGGKIRWGACTDSRCECLKYEEDVRPSGTETMVITHGQTAVVITTLAHPVADLDGGAANQYLVAAVHARGRSERLGDRWVFIGERQTREGWDQVWLPVEEGSG